MVNKLYLGNDVKKREILVHDCVSSGVRICCALPVDSSSWPLCLFLHVACLLWRGTVFENRSMPLHLWDSLMVFSTNMWN